MRIAVIGWGSLIWSPGSIEVKTRWYRDGPFLPIEFARISADGRLTLVIHEPSADVQTYWAVSLYETLHGARENLREREGTTLESVDAVRADEDESEITSKAKLAILRWLRTKRNLDAAVWTALGSNWQAKRERAFSPEDAVRYLAELEGEANEGDVRYRRATEYVRNTPDQIQTDVRKSLQHIEDFRAATLSAALFSE